MTRLEKKIVCGFCPVHCQVAAAVEKGRVVEVRPYKIGAPGRVPGPPCLKLKGAVEYADNPKRLNVPLRRAGGRGEGTWERVGWDEALDDIAARLRAIIAKHGPEAVALCTTGESNCSYEYRERFASLLGTPNLVTPLQICYGPALQLSLMMGGWFMNFPVISMETRCFMMLGGNLSQNAVPLWNGLRLLRKVLGMKLIVADPRKTQAAREADVWLPVRPNADRALLWGMIHTIIEEELYDKAFVDRWCHGWDRLVDRAKDYPPEKVAGITWVEAEKIREAARLYATTKPAAIWHCMGIEEAPNSTHAILLRFILPAITGNLDVPGGEPMTEPHGKVRVSADVMEKDRLPERARSRMIGGDRFPYFSWRTWEKVQAGVERHWGCRLSTHWWSGSCHGPTAFRAMVTGKPYPVRAVIQEANNPFMTFSNPGLVHEALMSLDLMVAMDVVMTPSCELADYVLPAASWLEKPVLWGGDYFHYFIAGPAAVPPLHERRSEFDFWRGLGTRLGQSWPWETLEQAIDYRLQPLGMTLEQLMERQEGYDESEPRYRKYEAKGFATPTGKFELCPTLLEELGIDPLPPWSEPRATFLSDPDLAARYPMILIGARCVHYTHAQGRELGTMRRRHPDPLAQISPEAGRRLGIDEGDWMVIETPKGRARFRCRFREMNPMLVHAEMGWWFPEQAGASPSLHGAWPSNVNVLFDDDPETVCDPVSGAWQLRGFQCRVFKET
jgi:thiosulfate reductase/polysulfide reductase chain A